MQRVTNEEKGLGCSMGNMSDIGAGALSFGKRVGTATLAMVVASTSLRLVGMGVDKIRCARHASAAKKAEVASEE